MGKKLGRYLFFVPLIVATCVWPVGGVDISGKIRGSVVDPSGAAVPQAVLAAHNQLTGTETKVTAGADGTYSFESLLPGLYSVTCEHAGFKKFLTTNVQVTSQQATTLDISLTVGAVVESVEVTGAATQVNTQNATIGNTLGVQTLQSFPVQGRDPRGFLALTQPGVVSGPLFHSGATEVVNGSRPAASNFDVDGTENIDYFNGNASVFPAVENLQEFTVLTNSSGAQYGRGGGGRESALIKSGTNAIHGMGWTYLKNQAWAANSWQGNRYGVARPSGSQQWYGGNVGGPVYLPKLYNGRDKTFFFFSYEYTHPTSQLLVQQHVPSAAERAGDFSSSFFPVPTINGQPTTELDSASFSPMANAMLADTSILPLPNGPNDQYNWLSPGSETDKSLVIKIDENFSQKHRVFVSLFRYRHITDWQSIDSWNYSAPTLPSGGTQGFDSTLSIWTINDTYNITGSMLNNVVVSLKPYTLNVKQWTVDKNLSWNHVGVPGVVPDTGADMTQMGIYVPGYTTNGFMLDGNYYDNDSEPAYYVADNFTWMKGRHTLQAGYDQRIMKNTKQQNWAAGGFYVFSAGNVGSTGNPFADFLLGEGATFHQQSLLHAKLNYPQISGYVQDQIKVNRRLTVNLGLRWEPNFPITEDLNRLALFRAGEQSTVFPHAPTGLVVPGDPGVPRGTYPIAYSNLGPRVSVAYDPTGAGKMSVRAAFGVYHDYDYLLGWNNIASTVPYGITYAPPGPVSVVDPYNGVQIFPFQQPLPGTNATKNYIFPSTPLTVDTPDPNYNVGAIYQWNMGYQWEPIKNYLFSVAYVGTHGSHLTSSYNLNSPLFVPNASTAGNQQSRRPYPSFSDIYVTCACVNSSYNGLQFTLNKRFSRGFNVLLSYSYSRSYDTGDSVASFFSTGPFRDSRNRQLDYGPSQFDFPNVLNIAYTWRLPFKGGVNKWVARTLGDWQWAGNLRAISGAPLTITSPNGFDVFSSNSAWANYVGGSLYGDHSSRASQADHWINPAAFCAANETGADCSVDPTAGVSSLALGNSKRGMVRGPGGLYNDMSLSKSFVLSERWGTFQLMAQAFNVFNHTVLQNPDTNIADKGGSFGTITSAAAPRTVQLVLRYSF